VAPPPPPSLADALAEADRLRASPRAAAERLERALDEHGDDPGAGLAAFSLGKLYLEQLHQPGRAAEAFARVIAAGRPRGLLEDAHARRVEALLADGRADEAREALAAFAAAFPASPRVEVLRARLP
jgi:hypothetical protein